MIADSFTGGGLVGISGVVGRVPGKKGVVVLGMDEEAVVDVVPLEVVSGGFPELLDIVESIGGMLSIDVVA